MYQFYYVDDKRPFSKGKYLDRIENHFHVEAVRPTMWEEHCLECSAPVCFGNCAYYEPRSDGRCKRFENGLRTFDEEKAICGEGVHVRFRKWSNMMTIIFPAMFDEAEYRKLYQKNKKLGSFLKKINNSILPQGIRWQCIRSIEYVRRRKLRRLSCTTDTTPDAFAFHGYSFGADSFRLIVEIFSGHTSVFRMSVPVAPGENFAVIPGTELSPECAKAGNLVKVYPENDVEAEISVLWCDFVRGTPVKEQAKPAPQVKCLVWDLDNTLWDGTLIETEQPDTLKPRDGVVQLLRALDERGVLLSVASKNDASAALPVLERLGLDQYFLYPQINWNPKSGNIREIARLLNIGVDALAFVDDTAFEREEVGSALPEVRVYDITDLPALLERPEFQIPVTEEGKKRRSMYQAEAKRNEQMQAENTDNIGFLKKCHLHTRIFKPTTDEEILRCFELVIRTNQLNMSGKKYTREEFDAVLNRPEHTGFAFFCEDDFGEYGIVGFGQYRKEQNRLSFTEFAMSCRVAGKYVESALFRTLLESESCTEGYMKVKKTKKNSLLRKSLEEIGFSAETDKEDETGYLFDTDLLNSDIVRTERSFYGE